MEIQPKHRFTVPLDTVKMKSTLLGWPYRDFPIEPYVAQSDFEAFQDQLVKLIRTIAKYQEVYLLCPTHQEALKAKVKVGATVFPVTFIDDLPYDDSWLRDSGPTFRLNQKGEMDALGLNFNGWGGRVKFELDPFVAEKISNLLGVTCHINPLLHGEGGSTLTDGEGTLIGSQACWVNDNRNPKVTEEQIQNQLKSIYNASKLVWCQGAKDASATDDHMDIKARFVKPGHLLVTVPPQNLNDPISVDSRKTLDILKNATDVKGNSFKITQIHEPRYCDIADKQPAVNTYLNYLMVNGALITVAFGDAQRDAECKKKMEEAFPDRIIEMIDMVGLYCYGGGGIHCLTQEIPDSTLSSQFDQKLQKYIKSQQEIKEKA